MLPRQQRLAFRRCQADREGGCASTRHRETSQKEYQRQRSCTKRTVAWPPAWPGARAGVHWSPGPHLARGGNSGGKTVSVSATRLSSVASCCIGVLCPTTSPKASGTTVSTGVTGLLPCHGGDAMAAITRPIDSRCRHANPSSPVVAV